MAASPARFNIALIHLDRCCNRYRGTSLIRSSFDKKEIFLRDFCSYLRTCNHPFFENVLKVKKVPPTVESLHLMSEVPLYLEEVFDAILWIDSNTPVEIQP